MHQGWSYLTCVIDFLSKEIVVYALSQRPDAQLVNEALLDAMSRQYLNITQNMSRNRIVAIIQQCFGSLKTVEYVKTFKMSLL
jgi:transposase InsO family protein